MSSEINQIIHSIKNLGNELAHSGYFDNLDKKYDVIKIFNIINFVFKELYLDKKIEKKFLINIK